MIAPDAPTVPYWPISAPQDGPDLDESRQTKPYGGEPSRDRLFSCKTKYTPFMTQIIAVSSVPI
mgnify:CR=1 FL=1